MARSTLIRKSDLMAALEAAKAAGYEHVSVVFEGDGRRLQVTAGNGPASAQSEMTELQKWRARRAP